MKSDDFSKIRQDRYEPNFFGKGGIGHGTAIDDFA